MAQATKEDRNKAAKLFYSWDLQRGFDDIDWRDKTEDKEDGVITQLAQALADARAEKDEQEFKDSFIVTFLATWVAVHYNDYILMGRHDELANPPAEDAIDVANDAWEKYLEALKS